MDLLAKKLLRNIQHNNLLKSGDSIVLMLSGGADSVALLSLMSEISDIIGLKKIVCMHLNHGYRVTAERDEKFARSIANSFGLKCFIKKLDISSIAKLNKNSFETQGRICRREFAFEIKARENCEYIVSAHHSDDLAETFMINLFRGTGLKGLGGMSLKNGVFIKPLLFATKSDLLNYLQRKNLTYVEDETNKQSIFLRNKIRNELLPIIESDYATDIKEKIFRTTQILNIENDYIETQTDRFLKKYFSEESEFYKLELSFDLSERAVFYRAIKKIIERLTFSPLDIHFKDIMAVTEIANFDAKNRHKNSKYIIVNNIKILREYNNLLFYKTQNNDNIDTYKAKPATLDISEHDVKDFKELRNKYISQFLASEIAIVDKDKVYMGIKVRKWKEGDRFTPLGMKGSKSLQDYFTDKKIPKRLRHRIDIITDSEKIIWVYGERVSELVKVDDATEKILLLKLEGGNYEENDEISDYLSTDI